jgi:hypothetical protein
MGKCPYYKRAFSNFDPLERVTPIDVLDAQDTSCQRNDRMSDMPSDRMSVLFGGTARPSASESEAPRADSIRQPNFNSRGNAQAKQ